MDKKETNDPNPPASQEANPGTQYPGSRETLLLFADWLRREIDGDLDKKERSALKKVVQTVEKARSRLVYRNILRELAVFEPALESFLRSLDRETPKKEFERLLSEHFEAEGVGPLSDEQLEKINYRRGDITRALHGNTGRTRTQGPKEYARYVLGRLADVSHGTIPNYRKPIFRGLTLEALGSLSPATAFFILETLGLKDQDVPKVMAMLHFPSSVDD